MLYTAREGGQGLAEYAIIITLVALVVIAVLLVMGPVVGNMFTKVNSGLLNNS